MVMDENLFDKLQELSGMIPERFNIIDEQIDVKLQMDYFKLSRKIKKQLGKNHKIQVDTLPQLADTSLDVLQQKELMIKLASIDDPKAFRRLEEFSQIKDNPLRQWSLLAMQESRMLLESNLLDEKQVFISTGLGGRGNMLRYFVVLIGENLEEYAPYQEKIVRSEFDFALQKNRSEVESIHFEKQYISLLVLIPIDIAFHQVLLSAVEECNQFGNFLKSNFLVTNVKTLSFDEINNFVEKNQLPDEEDYKELELDESNDDEEQD
jgi:hypothetical protein